MCPVRSVTYVSGRSIRNLQLWRGTEGLQKGLHCRRRWQRGHNSRHTLAAAMLTASTRSSHGGFKVNALPGAIVYPDWNSVDPELEPERVLDPETIRIFDCTEVSSIH